MMRQFAKLVLLGAAAAGTASVEAADNSKPYFGCSADVAFAESLWQSMMANQLVGTNAINVHPFEGNQPHGAIQQVTDSTVSVSGRTGRLIVKLGHVTKLVRHFRWNLRIRSGIQDWLASATEPKKDFP